MTTTWETYVPGDKLVQFKEPATIPFSFDHPFIVMGFDLHAYASTTTRPDPRERWRLTYRVRRLLVRLGMISLIVDGRLFSSFPVAPSYLGMTHPIALPPAPHIYSIELFVSSHDERRRKALDALPWRLDVALEGSYVK